MTGRTASLAPHPKPLRTVEQMLGSVNEQLREQFGLDPLSLYSIVVEGETDVQYLVHAAALFQAETGVDLLEAVCPDGAVTRISVVSPGTPSNPHQGGVPQMARLAEAIQPACFQYDAYYGVVFLFDHDTAGLQAGRDKLTQLGYVPDRHTLTLDPRQHPGACASKQVVIEDLLSLEIQHAFFSAGRPWCAAHFEDGKLRRYEWRRESKSELVEFVRTHAAVTDLTELVRVLQRVREVWGLPGPGVS